MARQPLTSGAGQDCRRDWVRINEVDRDVGQLFQAIDTLRNQVVELRRLVGLAGAGLYPFAIYQQPWRLVESPGSTDWRTFRVRGGRVITGENAEGFAATGTDGETSPYGGNIPATGDFTVPDSTPEYYVWLEVAYASGAWSAVVRHAEHPATADTYNPKPWATFPVMDGHRILIGKIDTDTNSSTKQAIVDQYQRGDLVLGPAFEVCKDGTTTVYYSIPGLAKEALPT